MTKADPLSREVVLAVDSEGLLGEILDLGEHLRDALWRVQSAQIAPESTPGGLQVVGVDGLERGGALAREALIPQLGGPLTVFSGPPPSPRPLTVSPGPPPASPLPVTVLLASYDGEDPAVLDAFTRTETSRRVVLTTGGRLAADARSAGVPVVPLPGGFPYPAAAIGYPLVVCLELARLAGLSGANTKRVEDSARHVARLAREWGPDSPPDSPAKRLAHAAAWDRDPDWALSAADAGEDPLQRVVTRILLNGLVELYRQVLTSRNSQP